MRRWEILTWAGILAVCLVVGVVVGQWAAPEPVVGVVRFEGAIDFGINGVIHNLKKGDLIGLEGGIPHDLKALETSTVRLSLNKADSAKRVEGVVNQ